MTINVPRWEGSEIVYFPDMDRQMKARLDSLGETIASIKADLAAIKPADEPNALKRYAWALPWIVVLFGNGILLYSLNAYIDNHVKTGVKAEIGEMPDTLKQHTTKLANI